MAAPRGFQSGHGSRKAWRAQAGWLFGALSVAALLASVAPAFAADSTPTPAAVDRGRRLAKQACAQCHAIEGAKASPLKDAPAFATLSQTFAGRNLEEILAQGLMTPHPPMPMFLANSQDTEDLLAYLYSVQVRRTAAAER